MCFMDEEKVEKEPINVDEIEIVSASEGTFVQSKMVVERIGNPSFDLEVEKPNKFSRSLRNIKIRFPKGKNK